MNLIIIAKSRITNNYKIIKLNNESVGLFINVDNFSLNLKGHFFDYNYFIDFLIKCDIDTQHLIKSIEPIKNILTTSSIDSVTQIHLTKLTNCLKDFEIYFDLFYKHNKHNHEILLNSYNTIQKLNSKKVESILNVQHKISPGYKIYGNTTWRLTNAIQNLSTYDWKVPVLDIDIRAQDFTVIFDLLNIKTDTDPFTYLATQLNLNRNDVKRLVQIIAFGASRDTILKVCYTEGISTDVYYTLISSEFCDKLFLFINKINKCKRLKSRYLRRPIQVEHGKNFSRYVQSSSSDLSLIILAKLQEYKISQHLNMFRHDEFIFYSDNTSTYNHIIDVFKTKLKTININKHDVNLFYTSDFIDGRNIISKTF